MAHASLYARCRRYYTKHHVLILWGIFLLSWLVSAFLSFHRYPQNYKYANFFAEDGDHFTVNILSKGFFGALLTTFNGYFIFGIYILTGIGFLVNDTLHGGQFAQLPASFAIVSYAFLGLCATLPILLLKSYVRLPYRLLLALLITLLPMPSFDYGTIGTIGNLKFPFVFICLVLLLYRVRLAADAKRIFFIDFVFAIGMFTTAGCYVILPLLFFSPAILPKKWRSRKAWQAIFYRHNYALWSFVVLCFIGLIQVAYIAIKGVPKLPGYLDQPYEWGKTIEVFIARPYLYPFLSSVYHHLRGIYVLLLSAVGLYLIAKFGKQKNRYLYAWSLIAIFFTTFIFIFNRTGVSFYYDHYQTSGFDNFYYTQNYIALLVAVVFFADAQTLLRKRYGNASLLLVILPLMILANMLYTNQSYAPNDFMQYQISPLDDQLANLCAKNTPNVTVTVYPFNFLNMVEPRNRACTQNLKTYVPSLSNYGLATSDNTAVPIGPGNPLFTQRFKAQSSHIHGIAIYVSTYYQTRIYGYNLILMNGSCTQTLLTAAVPTRVRDNSYLEVPFTYASNAGATYCFTVKPTRSAPQLALQLANPVVNPNVSLSYEGTTSPRDITFQVINK